MAWHGRRSARAAATTAGAGAGIRNSLINPASGAPPAALRLQGTFSMPAALAFILGFICAIGLYVVLAAVLPEDPVQAAEQAVVNATVPVAAPASPAGGD